MKNVTISEANTAIAQNIYVAFGRGDIPGVLAMCSPDIDWEVVGPMKDFPLLGARDRVPEQPRWNEWLPAAGRHLSRGLHEWPHRLTGRVSRVLRVPSRKHR